MPKAKKHNREINEDIREENEEFNKQWIAKNQLIGDDIVLADELDVSYDPEATIMCDGCCSQISIYNGNIIIISALYNIFPFKFSIPTIFLH